MLTKCQTLCEQELRCYISLLDNLIAMHLIRLQHLDSKE